MFLGSGFLGDGGFGVIPVSIVTGFLRTGNAPGLGQRFGFACFFLWVALVGYALYRDPAQRDGAA